MNPILFLDTETTGRWDFKAPPNAPHQPHIVQLAAMVASRDRVVASINIIIKPEGWDIAADVVKVHGIDNELATAGGIPRRAALAIFNQLCLLAKRIAIYNLDFDYNVLVAQFLREKQKHRMSEIERVCVMRAATPILKLPKPFKGKPGDEWKWPTLTEAYAHFNDGATFDGAHDAMVDVNALANVYWKMEEAGYIKSV